MLTNARILVKAILVFLLLSVASAATAQTFSFDNCKLQNLKSSINRGPGMATGASDYRHYPKSSNFSFDHSGITWGEQRLDWSKKTPKGVYVAYFVPPGGNPSVHYPFQTSRLNLAIIGNEQGTVRIQRNFRDMDPPVQFVCGSGGQTDPEPEQPANAEVAANCYLDPSSIRQAQQHLKSLGLYKSTIDGVSGRGTKAAIKKAKKLIGRKASAGDCITAKDITEFRLLAEAAVEVEELKTNTDEDDASETEGPIPEASNYQLSETQRLDAQRALKKFGFYNGMIDGDIGPATKLAVKSWQEATGYSATGELTVDQIDQLLLDEKVLPDILNPENGQRITAVMVQITNPTFDVYSCAFHLEFTNRTSGKSFDVVLYAEGSDGKFTATSKDIERALANSELTAEDNNWTALSIKAKKYDDPNVVCKPTNQNSYLITEDGTEGTFKIDSKGQLTMTDRPIVAVN